MMSLEVRETAVQKYGKDVSSLYRMSLTHQLGRFVACTAGEYPCCRNGKGCIEVAAVWRALTACRVSNFAGACLQRHAFRAPWDRRFLAFLRSPMSLPCARAIPLARGGHCARSLCEHTTNDALT